MKEEEEEEEGKNLKKTMKVKTMTFKNVGKSICFQSLLKPPWKQNCHFIPQSRSWPGDAELLGMSKSSALFMIKETFSSSSLHFFMLFGSTHAISYHQMQQLGPAGWFSCHFSFHVNCVLLPLFRFHAGICYGC